MAVTPERQTPPDITFRGDILLSQDTTIEYGWMHLVTGEVYWREELPWWAAAGDSWAEVRRFRHVVTERAEIISGPHKGVRLEQ